MRFCSALVLVLLTSSASASAFAATALRGPAKEPLLAPKTKAARALMRHLDAQRAGIDLLSPAKGQRLVTLMRNANGQLVPKGDSDDATQTWIVVVDAKNRVIAADRIDASESGDELTSYVYLLDAAGGTSYYERRSSSSHSHCDYEGEESHQYYDSAHQLLAATHVYTGSEGSKSVASAACRFPPFLTRVAASWHDLVEENGIRLPDPR